MGDRQSVSQSICRLVSQSVDQAACQSVSQSVRHSVSRSVNWSVGQSVSQSANRNIDLFLINRKEEEDFVASLFRNIDLHYS